MSQPDSCISNEQSSFTNLVSAFHFPTKASRIMSSLIVSSTLLIHLLLIQTPHEAVAAPNLRSAGLLFSRDLFDKSGSSDDESTQSPTTATALEPPTASPIDPGPTESPSNAPSLSPSQTMSVMPSLRPSTSPSTVPSDSPLPPAPRETCGVTTDVVLQGLTNASLALSDMGAALESYGRLDNQRDGDRELLWNLLVSGVTTMVGTILGQGPLSNVADMCTIASTIYTFFGPSSSEPQGPDVEALFDEVFQRFDLIDEQLNDIQDQIEEGFTALKAYVSQQFADQELDEWIQQRLGKLSSDYLAYTNPSHTSETREPYKNTFRTTCSGDNSPFAIFKTLYSHTCKACDKLDGKANQYILDTFITTAVTTPSLDTTEKRIRWFRQAYARVMIGAMVESLYLHMVCLYQPDGVCQTEDPVWRERLQVMAEALEESADSLSRAEDRLKCPRKRIKITEVCDLPNSSCNDPNVMHLKVKVDKRDYWPQDERRDCPAGNFFDACAVPKSDIVNGKCYALKNPIQQEFTWPKNIEFYAGDSCTFATITKFRASSAAWYGDRYQCGTRTMELNADAFYGNAKIKMEIESVPLG